MPRIVYQKGDRLMVYGKPPVVPATNGVSSQVVTGTQVHLPPTSVAFANALGELTSDPGLTYGGGYLTVGASNPGVFSGIFLNAGRATLEAAIGGLIVRVGVATGGAYDATKHVRFFNGTNTLAYLDMYTDGTGPYTHQFVTALLANNNFADDIAAAAGGVPLYGWYHNAGDLRMRIA